MAEITLVKGETSALDRTWMSMPDGSTRQVAVHAVHDLPHLVVESLFGIEDGLWGVLARGGFAAANRARTRSRGRRARLVTDVPLDDLGARNWRGHIVAKAATNAVMNRWQDGPDTPDGVRPASARTPRRTRITGGGRRPARASRRRNHRPGHQRHQGAEHGLGPPARGRDAAAAWPLPRARQGQPGVEVGVNPDSHLWADAGGAPCGTVTA